MSALGLLMENERQDKSIDQVEHLGSTISYQNHRLRQRYEMIQKVRQTILFDQRWQTMVFGCHITFLTNRKVIFQALSNGIKKRKYQCRSESSQCKIRCWFWISKRKINVSNQRVLGKDTCNWCYDTMRRGIFLDICENDTWTPVVIHDVCCNMKFYDNKGDDHTKVNIELFLKYCRSVQTSCLICSRVKNWVAKDEILMMLGCTNIVWQNRNTSSASSSLPKHHFWNLFSLMRNWVNKEATIKIDSNIWKSVVFSKYQHTTNNIINISEKFQILKYNKPM